MAKGLNKDKARKYFKAHPTCSIRDLQEFMAPFNPDSVRKYHREFVVKFGTKLEEVSATINMKKLEHKLNHLLETNPTQSVLKSCIDFMKLKLSTDTEVDEFDMSAFILKGKSE